MYFLYTLISCFHAKQRTFQVIPNFEQLNLDLLMYSVNLSLPFYFLLSLCLVDEVTRDYAYGETDNLVRECRLLPWVPSDLEGVNSYTPEPPNLYFEVC